MNRCQCCGNEYDNPIKVIRGDQTAIFDCFECAIHVLAPTCEHCGCKVIGHGVEAWGRVFCCAHCASSAGARGITDRSP